MAIKDNKFNCYDFINEKDRREMGRWNYKKYSAKRGTLGLAALSVFHIFNLYSTFCFVFSIFALYSAFDFHIQNFDVDVLGLWADCIAVFAFLVPLFFF